MAEIVAYRNGRKVTVRNASLEVFQNNGQTAPIHNAIEKMKLTFEDFKPGHFGTFGPHHVSRDDIIAFATEFDPQPMHLDERASRSLLKGLSGSGWHMCSLLMRICWDGFIHNIRLRGGAGCRGSAMGFAAASRRRHLTVSVEVLDTRPSKSRSDVGFVRIKNDMRNASGQPCCLVRCR
jgi:acyl dehydratase